MILPLSSPKLDKEPHVEKELFEDKFRVGEGTDKDFSSPHVDISYWTSTANVRFES